MELQELPSSALSLGLRHATGTQGCCWIYYQLVARVSREHQLTCADSPLLHRQAVFMLALVDFYRGVRQPEHEAPPRAGARL